MQKTLEEDSSIEGLAGKHSWQKIEEAAEKQPELLDTIETQEMECDCYDGHKPRDEELNEYKAKSYDLEEKKELLLLD